MNLPTIAANISFLALFASIGLALWRGYTRAGAILLTVACVAGLVSTSLTLAGPITLLLGLMLWLGSVDEGSPDWRARFCLGLLALWAVAAGFHVLPGFEPWVWMSDFGRDANRPLTWHFDKALAGLLLLWVLMFVPQGMPRPAVAWRFTPIHLGLAAAGCVALPALAVASGIAALDPRWLSGTLIWLTGNLFLTVVAEEVFFRGLIQGGLMRMLESVTRHAYPIALVIGALIFGAAHLGWGLQFAAIATVAGLIYGTLYGRDQSLIRAIAGHFAVNAVTLLLLRSPLG